MMDDAPQEKSQGQNIVIQQLRPLVPLWITFVIALVIGLAWGWVVEPVQWSDAGPVHLEHSYKVEWVKLVAAQLDRPGGREQAERLLIAAGDVGSIIDQLIQDNPDLARELNELKTIYEGVREEAMATQQAAATRGSTIPVTLIIIVIVILVLWGVIAGFGGMIWVIVKNAAPLLLRRGGKRSTGGPTAESRLGGIAAAREAAETQATDFSASDMGPPVVQYMSTYLMGDDLYDDSFSVELPSGEFLGETGAGISETIGVGEPKKVTAIEAWLFDKNDIRTVTKVLMSEHAFYDEALRAKLAPKGEAILAEPNATLYLDTQTLRVQVRVVDLAYGPPDPQPETSYFERLTLELAAWQIEGGGGEGEGGDSELPSPEAFGDTISF